MNSKNNDNFGDTISDVLPQSDKEMFYLGSINIKNPVLNEIFLEEEQITKYYTNIFENIPKNIKPYNDVVNKYQNYKKLRICKLFKILDKNYEYIKNSDDTFHIFILSNNTVEISEYNDCGIYQIDDIKIDIISISDQDISSECMFKCKHSIQYMINCCLDCISEPQIILRTQNLKGKIENGFNFITAKIFYDIIMDYFLSDDYDPNTFSFDNFYRTRTYLKYMYKLSLPQSEDKNYIY